MGRMVGRIKYLEKRGKSYRVNVPVPRPLQAHMGKAHLRETIGAVTEKVAEGEAPAIVARFLKQIKIAEKALAGTPDIDAMALADRENELPAEAVEFIADDNESTWGTDKADRYKGIATGKLQPLNLYRDEWLASLKREKTRQEFGAIFTEFEAFARTRKADDLNKVTGSLVMQWRNDIVKAGKASATVNKRLTAMSSYFKHCMQHEAVEGNPFTGRRVTVEPTRERRRYTPDELVKLFTLADDERRLEMAVALLGMRQSAQWLLRAEHVETITAPVSVPDPADSRKTITEYVNVICLRIPKVKKEKQDRLIPIPDAILPAVQKLVELAPPRGGYLCAAPATAKGKSRGSEPGRRYMRWLVSNGFGDEVDWHSFRRTAAWLLETAGLPENMGARVIGHAMGITYGLYSGESDMGWMKPQLDVAYNRLPDGVTRHFKDRAS